MVIGTYTSAMLLCKNFRVGEADACSGAAIVTLIETDKQVVYIHIFQSGTFVGDRDAYTVLIV